MYFCSILIHDGLPPSFLLLREREDVDSVLSSQLTATSKPPRTPSSSAAPFTRNSSDESATRPSPPLLFPYPSSIIFRIALLLSSTMIRIYIYMYARRTARVKRCETCEFRPRADRHIIVLR